MLRGGRSLNGFPSGEPLKHTSSRPAAGADFPSASACLGDCPRWGLLHPSFISLSDARRRNCRCGPGATPAAGSERYASRPLSSFTAGGQSRHRLPIDRWRVSAFHAAAATRESAFSVVFAREKWDYSTMTAKLIILACMIVVSVCTVANSWIIWRETQKGRR